MSIWLSLIHNCLTFFQLYCHRSIICLYLSTVFIAVFACHYRQMQDEHSKQQWLNHSTLSLFDYDLMSKNNFFAIIRYNLGT